MGYDVITMKSMKAGHEIDILIAEKVMKHTVILSSV